MKRKTTKVTHKKGFGILDRVKERKAAVKAIAALRSLVKKASEDLSVADYYANRLGHDLSNLEMTLDEMLPAVGSHVPILQNLFEEDGDETVEAALQAKSVEAAHWEEPSSEQIQEAINLQLEQEAVEQEELDTLALSVEVLEVIRRNDTIRVTISRYGHIEQEFYETNSQEDFARLGQFYRDIDLVTFRSRSRAAPEPDIPTCVQELPNCGF